MPASTSFLRSRDHEMDAFEFEARTPASPAPPAQSSRARQPNRTLPDPLRRASLLPARSLPRHGPISAGRLPTRATASLRPHRSQRQPSGPARKPPNPAPRERVVRQPAHDQPRQAHDGVRRLPQAPSGMEHTTEQAQRTACGPKAALLVRPTAHPARGPQSLPLRRGDGATAIPPAPRQQPRPAQPHAPAANRLWQPAQRRGRTIELAIPPGPSRGRRSADECGRRFLALAVSRSAT